MQKISRLRDELIQIAQSGQIRKIEKLYARHKNDAIPDADIWKIFAGANSEKNKFKEVLFCCKQLLQLSPDNYQILYNAGVASQHLSDYQNAINYYESSIRINSKYLNAYSNCAFSYKATGNIETAILYYQHALNLENIPDIRIQLGKTLESDGQIELALNEYIKVYNNNRNNETAIFEIARLYYEASMYTESEAYYQKLLNINSNNTIVLNNLGRLYEETGNIKKAIEYFQKAIKSNSEIGLLHRNIGKAYLKQRDLPNAEDSFLQSLAIEPHPESYFNLGKIYGEINNLEKAREYYIKALNIEIPPDIEKPDEFLLSVKYFLSSVTDAEKFDQDKRSFVSDLFDGYAEKFDNHLINNLEYKTPEIIKDVLEGCDIPADNSKNVIDLGCGTGLCAHFLKPYSNQLIGIDLSQKMIGKAKELGLYDQLIVGEITEEVNNIKIGIDIAIAADVFVYVGGLREVLTACNKKMPVNSIVIFSTEVTIDDTADYKIYDSGRYKHSIDYLNRISVECGFNILQHQSCVLRKEHGAPVEGTISTIKKI